MTNSPYIPESARLAAFERLTEGNFFSFSSPEHQEEYIWQIVDAVLDAAGPAWLEEAKERLGRMLADAERRRDETVGEPWKAAAVTRASVLGEAIGALTALGLKEGCPTCGSGNPFVLSDPCSRDSHEPDEWHRANLSGPKEEKE